MIAYALLDYWLTWVGFALLITGVALLPTMVPACSLWLEYIRNSLKEICAAEITLGLRPGSGEMSTRRGKIRPGDAKLLVSPLTHRPCVAYSIRRGYLLEGGLVLLNTQLPDEDVVPFMFDDGTHVTLADSICFIPGSNSLVAIVRPSDIPDEMKERFRGFGGLALLENKRARYVEWILPVGATCAISGAGSPPLEYRGVREVHVKDAQIQLLPSEGFDMEQQLNRDRATLESWSRSISRWRWVSMVGSLLLIFGGIGLGAFDIVRNVPESVETRRWEAESLGAVRIV